METQIFKDALGLILAKGIFLHWFYAHLIDQLKKKKKNSRHKIMVNSMKAVAKKMMARKHLIKGDSKKRLLSSRLLVTSRHLLLFILIQFSVFG